MGKDIHLTKQGEVRAILELERLKTKSSQLKAEVLGEEKVLVLTDLHIPFHREDMIIDIVLKHRHEISTIIFGGDIVDCYSISVFSKEVRRPLIDEMIIAYKFLNRIDRLTPEIKKVLIWGNHEYRYVKYLADNPSELNALHSDNILDSIVSGFTHHDRLSRRKTVYPPLSQNFHVVDKWYIQYRDLIVAHPKNFSKVNLKTATNAVEYFIAQGLQFKSLMIGHTHKSGSTIKFNKWVGETGCLCQEMEYSQNGNLGYTPQIYGYALVSINNGVTDINESRVYVLEVEEEGEMMWQDEFDLRI